MNENIEILNSEVGTSEPKKGEINPKNKKKTGLIIAIIILIALIAAFLGYTCFIENSERLYTKAIEEGYSLFNEGVDLLKQNTVEFKASDNSMMIEGNLKLKTDITELAAFSNYSYDYKIGFDKSKKAAQLYLGILEKNKLMVDLLAQIMEDNTYLKSDKLLDKVVYGKTCDNTDEDCQGNLLDMSVFETTINYDAIKQVGTIVKNEFINYIKNTKIKKGSTEVKGLNGKVNRHTLTITKEDAIKIKNSLIEAILNDATLLNNLKDYTESTEEELKEKLKEAQQDNSMFEDYSTIDVILYTKKYTGAFLGFSINEMNEEVLSYTKNDGKENLKLKEDGKTVLTMEKENKVAYITIANSDDEPITLKYIEKDTTSGTVEFVGYNNATKLSGTVEFETKTQNVTAQDLNIKIDLNVEDNSSKNNIVFELTNTITVNKALENIDTKNAISSDELTEEDAYKLLNNLQAIFSGTPFEDLMSLFLG